MSRRLLLLALLVATRAHAQPADHAQAVARPGNSAPEYSTITVAEIERRLSAGASPVPLPALDQWRAASPAVHLTLTASRLSVEGTGNRWAYQVMSPEIPVEPNTYYRVALPTRVTSGIIGIGVLDQSGQTWISSPLDAAPFTFFSGPNKKVQLVVADATPTLGTVRPGVFEILPAR